LRVALKNGDRRGLPIIYNPGFPKNITIGENCMNWVSIAEGQRSNAASAITRHCELLKIMETREPGHTFSRTKSLRSLIRADSVDVTGRKWEWEEKKGLARRLRGRWETVANPSETALGGSWRNQKRKKRDCRTEPGRISSPATCFKEGERPSKQHLHQEHKEKQAQQKASRD